MKDDICNYGMVEIPDCLEAAIEKEGKERRAKMIELANLLDKALHRVEPKNCVLTLKEATGSDEPVWLEAMSRVFIADVCVSPDARTAQIQTIGKASCAYLPLCDYGVLWRCWLRKPTKEEMEGTPWEGDSRE